MTLEDSAWASRKPSVALKSLTQHVDERLDDRVDGCVDERVELEAVYQPNPLDNGLGSAAGTASERNEPEDEKVIPS